MRRTVGAYNFKKQFVEPIRAGTKHHTIRAVRIDGRVPKVGELLTLYCGMRTKNCLHILTQPVTCTLVQKIRIFEGPDLRKHISIEDIRLDADEREALARADGFPDFGAMMRFWDGRLPFEGHIVHWRPPC
jgi:hypothetical protein